MNLYDWLNKFYNVYMAAIVDIVGVALELKSVIYVARNQPNKS